MAVDAVAVVVVVKRVFEHFGLHVAHVDLVGHEFDALCHVLVLLVQRLQVTWLLQIALALLRLKE